MTTDTTHTIHKGLEGIYEDTTEISHIDGQEGKLTIRGYSIEEFANDATNEEVMYLLFHGEFPNQQELIEFQEILSSNRSIPDVTVEVLREAAAKNVDTMSALRMGMSTMTISLVDELEGTDYMATATKLIARVPVVLATYLRLIDGKEPIEPDTTLSHAANFIYMLEGEVAESDRVRAFDTYLNTVSDHGLNASTFTARTIVSTNSDMVSAVSGAIGALKGPLHGGAPGPALEMVKEIGSIENAEPYLREKLENGERIMGFGHRVYKSRDPRAEVLSKASEKLFTGEKREFYEFVTEVEKLIIDLLEEYKPGRRLFTNVEFYTALVHHGNNFDPDIFSSLFAMGRIAGWCAHIIEQYNNNRLIRPRLEYVGEFGKEFVPLTER